MACVEKMLQSYVKSTGDTVTGGGGGGGGANPPFFNTCDINLSLVI